MGSWAAAPGELFPSPSFSPARGRRQRGLSFAEASFLSHSAPGRGASTTPGNGSLGSGVDEERGDMRYVVRIAGTQRAIESSNAHCARRQPGGPARPSAASKPTLAPRGRRWRPRRTCRSAAGRPNASGVRRARGRVPRPATRPPGASEPSPPARTPGAAFVPGEIARRGGRRGGGWGAARTRASKRRPRIGQGYPPNLSISVSGGKETNRDCPSSGERSGNSPDLKSGPPLRGGGPSCSLEREPPAPRAPGPFEARRPSPLERGAAEGESPVRPRAAGPDRRRGARPSTSRVAWECCPKREVNSFQG